LNDRIYWRLIVQSLLITILYNSSQFIYCLGLAPFSFPCLNSLATSEVTEHFHTSSIYNIGKGLMEITNSNSSSVILCLFVAAEKCLATRYLATDVLLLLRE
jgi:hypothetical protein